MDRTEFTGLIKTEFDRVLNLNETKGKEYAGEDNALSNFYRHASQLNVSPYIVWAVYAGKHWDAIESFCRTGTTLSEDIDGRIDDLILYLLLLRGLIGEANAR